MGRKFLLLCAAVAACAFAAPVNAAQSDDCTAAFGAKANGAWTCSQSQSFTFDEQVFDLTPCQSEAWIGDGRLDITNHYTVYAQSNGKTVFNTETHADSHYSGTGLVTGKQYGYNATSNQSTSWDFDGDANHDTIVEQSIGHGPGQDQQLQVHFTIHQTVDANGNYLLSVENAFITCADETDHEHINQSIYHVHKSPGPTAP
jgi:hypothetical protein